MPLVSLKALGTKQTPSLGGDTQWLGTSPESSVLLPMSHFLRVGCITPKHTQILKYQLTCRNNAFESLYRKSERAIVSSLPFLSQTPLVYGIAAGMCHNRALYWAVQRRLFQHTAANSLAPNQKWNRRNPCILRHSQGVCPVAQSIFRSYTGKLSLWMHAGKKTQQ